VTKERRNRIVAWGLCLFAVIGITTYLAITLIDEQRRGVLDQSRIAEVTGLWFVAITFSILGALIIYHQPQNRFGWLLMLPAIARVLPIEKLVASPPATLTPGYWFLYWLNGWAWMLLIFPILLLPLHFPTGRPPSPRWRWVNWLALSMWGLLAFVYAFPRSFADNGMLPNPIGFLPPELPQQIWSSMLWSICLFLLAAGSVVSLFVRYRRAQTAERQQIKWLAYASALFVVVYSLVVSNGFTGQSTVNELLLTTLFSVSVFTFALAIGIAVLRYRLFDIDVIIRKTLVYAIMSGLLALVYFGSVVLLQNIVGGATDEQSPLVIVISTLMIAAMFGSLRRRVQSFIDRRFYRRKVNAQQILAKFAQTARDEVSLEALTAEMGRVVQDTMEPASVSVWLKESRS